MWFWYSLIAILFWSGSDLFSKMGSPSEDKYSHWKMVMAVGGVMGIHAFVLILGGVEFTPRDIVTYLPASALYILSMILGYVGLRYIMLSISTPICNSSGAVAALLCFFLLGDRMTGLQFFAVCLITGAVFALSVIEKRKDDELRAAAGQVPDPRYTKSVIAVAFPLLYCAIDGLGTFVDGLLLDGYIEEASANIAYELTFLLMAVFAFIYVVIVKKQIIVLSKEKPKLVAGLCETAGQLAYIYAIAENTIVAAPMISSYCIASLLWARVVLKEKLSFKQYLVIAVAAVGIVIMGME